MDHTVWSLTYWQLRMEHRPRFQLKIRICKTYFRISRNAVQSFFYFEDDFCLVIKSIILTICIWTFVTFNWNTKIIFINWQVTSCGRMNLDAVSILQSPTLWVHVVQDVKKSYSGLPGPNSSFLKSRQSKSLNQNVLYFRKWRLSLNKRLNFMSQSILKWQIAIIRIYWYS